MINNMFFLIHQYIGHTKAYATPYTNYKNSWI